MGVARDLRDPLVRNSFASTPELDTAVGEIPVDSSPKSYLTGALHHIEHVVNEGRAVLRRFLSSPLNYGALEQALLEMIREFPAASAPCRALITGRPKALDPETQEQVCLIGREALLNALRHSQATLIEIEVEYCTRGLRLVIRDNGCGIDPELVRAGRASHWGLQQMEERARNLGAQLRIWTRRGLGTEVEVSL